MQRTKPTMAALFWAGLWAILGVMVLGVDTVQAQEDKSGEQDQAADQAQQDMSTAGTEEEESDEPATVKLTPVDPPSMEALKDARKNPKARKQAPTETPTGPVTGAPAVRCDETTHDFGESWAGGMLEHSFTLRNAGDQVLKIESVKPSCGCTVAKGYDKEIAPGASGKIPVSLNSKKVHNRFTKYITVNSNDPVTPALRLQITGEVKQFVSVAPQTLSMGHIREGEAVTKVAKLTNNTDKPFELKLKESTVGPFSAELVTQEEGKVYHLQVTANPPFQPKLNNGSFTLLTNLDQMPEIQIPVTAYVPARLDLRPEQLVLPREAGREQRRLIKFTNNGTVDVKVTSAEVDDEDLQLEVIERTPGKSYDIKVTIPADYKAPNKPRTITLRTSDAERPTLTVPVRGQPSRKRPADQLVGMNAPAAEFTTVNGNVIRTGSPSDKVTVLDFFASWCGFCKKQIPTVSALYKDKYANHPNVQFVGVSQDTLQKEGQDSKRSRTPQQIAEMWNKIADKGFDYALDPTLEGKSKFMVQSFPTLVLIGKTGKIEAVHFGAKAGLDTILNEQIEKLLVGESLASSAAESDPEIEGGRQTSPKAEGIEARNSEGLAAQRDKVSTGISPGS